MNIRRIGFVSSLEQEGVGDLHKAKVIVTRDAQPPARYGRAAVASLASPGRQALPYTGADLVWGNDEEVVGKLIAGSVARLVVAALSAKVKRDGPISKAMARRERNGQLTDVYVIKKKGTLTAADLMPDTERSVEADPSKPSTASNAPRVPSKPRERTAGSARQAPQHHPEPVSPPPTVPRVKAVAAKPVRKATKPRKASTDA